MRLLTSVVLVFTLLTASAQQLPLETYTPANGLVDARVIKMFQDSKGRIYFLTRKGFNIFDGQRFNNYGDGENNRTEIINGITEYKDGSVRLYSFDGNIYEVSGSTVTIDSSQRKLLSEVNNILDIAADEKIVVTNYLLLKEKNKKFEQINIPFRFYKIPRIDNICWIDPYLVFFRNIPDAGYAIYLYHYKTQLVRDSLVVENVASSATDKKGNIYFFSKKWMQLDRTALQNGKLQVTLADFADEVPASFSNATISFDNNNNLWLSNAEMGYCKLNMQNKTKEYFTVAAGLLSGAGFVFQDVENNYWFASLTNGVQKMQQSPLVRISSFKEIPTGYVNTMNADEKGNIFTCSSNGFFLNDDKIPENNASTVYKPFYFRDQYWQFTNYKTLKSSKGVQFNLADYVNGYSLNDMVPNFTSIDREGRLIISGIALFIIDSKLRLYTYRLPYFCDNVVVDEKNNYWCFTRNNMILKLEWKDGKLYEVYKKIIPDLNPRFSLLWNNTTILLGTRFEGIKIFRWKNNELTCTGSISRKNGLPNSFIYSLLKKNNQQLLAGTGTGLIQISMNEKDTITENLSLRNNIFPPFVSLLNTPDSSTICLTGSGNLYRLQKDTKFSSGYVPVAFFTSINVNDKQINNETHAFSYQENNFSFSISAPSFLDNKNMKFHFLLTGDGTHWEQHTNNADYAINNLPPGSYTLTATVQFPGRFYPDKQLLYNFTIKNPFWKQWWFITLTVLTAIAIIYLLFNNYYKKQLQKKLVILEKKQAIEKERTRIATDMHDDFGASLSRIKFLSEKLQLHKPDSPAEKTDLGKISIYSDEMSEKLNEIVWALNQRYDSLGDLVSFCRSYASEYLQDKNIKLNFNAGEMNENKIQGEVRRNIFLVIKESLQNIVKHAAATEVTVSFSYDKLVNEIRVAIADNGKGIDKETIRPFANGLENMKKRMADINGSFSIENKEARHGDPGGRGTQISISAPT